MKRGRLPGQAEGPRSDQRSGKRCSRQNPGRRVDTTHRVSRRCELVTRNPEAQVASLSITGVAITLGLISSFGKYLRYKST
jgi:hypothetical protein